MKDRKIKAITYILAALVLMCILPVSKSLADQGYTFKLHISDYQALLDLRDGSKLENLNIKYWKMDEETAKKNTKDIVTDLKDKTEQELNEAFGQGKNAPIPDKDGNFKIDNLEKGTYYFREEVNPNKKLYMAPFAVKIPGDVKPGDTVEIKKTDSEPGKPHGDIEIEKKSSKDDSLLEGAEFKLFQVIDGELVPVPLNSEGNYSSSGSLDLVLKTNKEGKIIVKGLPQGEYVLKELKAPNGYIIEKEDTSFIIKASKNGTIIIYNKPKDNIPPKHGDFNFFKYAKGTNGKQIKLEGASFKVTKLVNDKYENVMKDGSPYTVVSNSEGKFKVENLEYGTYYLWEIKAPKGYAELKDPIKFEIGKDSDQKLIPIENKKTPPVKVPETGDLAIVILAVVSIALIGVGYKLTKSKSDKE